MTDTFDDFVDRQNQLAKDAEQSVDWAKELEEWRAYLKQFKSSVADFLQEHMQQDRVRLEYKAKRNSEENIGNYDVEVITIMIGNAKVELDPVGTVLIGAKGRVDMKGPKGTVKVVLVPKHSKGTGLGMQALGHGETRKEQENEKQPIEWVWKLATPPPSVKYTEFTKESFRTAIMEVVNG